MNNPVTTIPITAARKSANSFSGQYAEALLLGRLLNEPSKLLECKVTSKHFLGDTNRLIFETIQEIDSSGRGVDMATVNRELGNKTGRTWLNELSYIMEQSFIESFFENAQDAILEEFKIRQINQIIIDLQNDFDLDRGIQELMDIDRPQEKSMFSLGEAAMAAFEHAKQITTSGKLVGLPTGLTKLDEAIGGLQSPDLLVIGGRPAMGKTSVILNMMLANGKPVGFFSTEQPSEQIGLRALSIEASVSARKVRTATCEKSDFDRMASIIPKLARTNIQIHDKSEIHISEIRRVARKMKYTYDVGAIYVDYIQRIHGSGESFRLQVSDVVKGLKSIARELDIPVVALAQVNRDVEKRPDKRPRMSDLVESGVIEQEADEVVLLYRDEVYDSNTSDKGVMEMLIDKNRHGPTGKLKFAWIGDHMQIKNLYQQAEAF